MTRRATDSPLREPRPQPGPLWHHLTVDDVLIALSADLERGLGSLDVESRRSDFGPNSITQRRGAGRLRRVLSQFNQALVIILIVAGATTAFLNEWVDSGVIFGVVVVNAVIGYLQEARAVKAIEALSHSMTAEASVVREGQRMRLSAVDLVPGDIVHLQAGDKIPADMRLAYTRDLRVDESALTGESLPVDKQTDPLSEETTLADRLNMAYATTLATSGQGVGIVVTTGDSTELGRISHLIGEARQLKTPLTRKIGKFSRLLLFIILGMAVITAGVALLRGQGLFDVFMAAVALAVGAIPEGLPAAVTITLAIGVSRMARRRAIVRRLPAVETLGSTTVICSDKTGTLTENQMTVQRFVAGGRTYAVTGSGYTPQGEIWVEGEGDDAPPPGGGAGFWERSAGDGGGAAALGAAAHELLLAGLLCNDSSLYREDGHWRISGDPTEAALIVVAGKADLHTETMQRLYPRLDTVPFESEHQYMATLHHISRHAGAAAPPTERAYAKGAVEKILARSTAQLGPEGLPIPLEPEQIERDAAALAADGLRVLAFASKDLPQGTSEISHGDVNDGLTFLGLQGMIDPPRGEALAAIRACHAAGVQVKMITGDHVLTAATIARQLDLTGPDSTPLTGAQLEAISDADLPDAAEETFVFARVTPEQKLRLVNALQSRSHIVAMTGDGVNDAPALRQADIGVAMGVSGTEVAKEASDMILTDDNFASIEAAVEEGRGVFDNLTKFIAWTLPTNLGEGLVIIAAIFAGVALPILPVQILWINMTTAVLLGLTLAFEPKEEGIMNRPPRPARAPILNGALISRVVIVGVVLLAGAFGLFEWAQQAGHTIQESRTVAVNVFVFGELFYLFNCRSLTAPSWQSGFFGNHFLLGGVTLMIALQLAYTYVPVMNELFGSAAISWIDWALIIASGVVAHGLIEIEKGIRRHRARK